MPKKQTAESQNEQSERFKREAQKLIDAGELNPIDAAEALERLVTRERLGQVSRAKLKPGVKSEPESP